MSNDSGSAADATSPARYDGATIVLLVGCVLCAILDGYDVVVISYVVPALSQEWAEPLASFGVVFSIGLIGLVAGSLGLAPLADQYGRRRVMIGALILGALATLANSLVDDLAELIVCRFFVGLAMGVLIALVIAVAHEASPVRHRAVIVAIVGCGLSLGNLLSGLIASYVIPRFGWQPLFLGATAVNVVVAILFMATLRDSRAVVKSHPPRYLSRIGSLFRKDLAKLTTVLWLLHFGGVGANYMLISWLPSLLVRSGYATADAAVATSLISLGGLVGGLVSGFALARFGRAWLLFIYASAVVLILLLPSSLGSPALYALNFLIGVCIVGGYISNSVVTSQLYPAASRASGLGWAQGIGRTGSVVTPLFVALALQWNASLTQILVMAAGFPLLGVIATLLLGKFSVAEPAEADPI